MAPEYMFQGIVSIKADIFSLGVIIIEILTGYRRYPFHDDNNPESTATSFQHFKDNVRRSNQAFAQFESNNIVFRVKVAVKKIRS
jgi:serine/threonine protein kinase